MNTTFVTSLTDGFLLLWVTLETYKRIKHLAKIIVKAFGTTALSAVVPRFEWWALKACGNILAPKIAYLQALFSSISCISSHNKDLICEIR